MQAQMMLYQAVETYQSSEFGNEVLERCWDICYDRNLTRAELVSGGDAVSGAKAAKMSACGRKCVARHFEVMQLMNGAREQRQQEAAAQMM